MKTKVIGGLNILLGALTAIGPRTIFHVCGGGMGGAMTEMEMPCAGIPKAGLIAGIILAVLGIALIAVGNKKAVSIVLGILSAASGIVIIGIPTFIVGVCGGAHMHCHMVTRPALIIIGAVTVFVAIINIVLANASQKAASQVENQQKESEDKKKVVLTAEQ